MLQDFSVISKWVERVMISYSVYSGRVEAQLQFVIVLH